MITRELDRVLGEDRMPLSLTFREDLSTIPDPVDDLVELGLVDRPQ